MSVLVSQSLASQQYKCCVFTCGSHAKNSFTGYVYAQAVKTGMGGKPTRGRIPEDSAAGGPHPADVEAQRVEAGKPVTY